MDTILARGVTLCRSEDPTPPAAPPPAPIIAAEPAPAPATPVRVVRASGDKRDDFEVSIPELPKVWITHTRCPGGLRHEQHRNCVYLSTIHRKMVVDDPDLCALLNKRRSKEIDDIVMQESRWTEDQLRKRADLEGKPILKELVEHLKSLPGGKRFLQLQAATSTALVASTTPAKDALPSGPTSMTATAYRGEARGMFLDFEVGFETGVFVDIFGVRLDGNGSSEERKEWLRYDDVSLLFAIQKARVEKGQEIHILPGELRTVSLQEQRTGACGRGKSSDVPHEVRDYDVQIIPRRSTQNSSGPRSRDPSDERNG